jgi:serine/threonine protein kinase
MVRNTRKKRANRRGSKQPVAKRSRSFGKRKGAGRGGGGGGRGKAADSGRYGGDSSGARRAQHNQRGGKYLARGSYGCVFKPAFRCSDGSTFDGISKAFKTREYAEEEKQLTAEVDRIDPKFEWHLKTGPVCVMDQNDRNVRDLESCSHDLKHPIYILQEEDGGTSLRDLFDVDGGRPTNLERAWAALCRRAFGKKAARKGVRARHLLSVFEKMGVIALGAAAMHKKGYAHTDIKYDNCVYSAKRGRFNIIDFGLMSKIGDTDPSNNLVRRHDKGYWVCPLDYALLRKGLVAEGAEAVGKFLRETHRRGYMPTFEDKYTSAGLYRHSYNPDVVKANLEFVREKLGGAGSALQDYIGGTLDAHGIGILCVVVMNTVLGREFAYDRAMAKKARSLRFAAREELAGRGAKKVPFQKLVAHNLNVFVHKVCTPYLRERAASADVHRLWREMVAAIRTHPADELLVRPETAESRRTRRRARKVRIGGSRSHVKFHTG